MVEQQGISNPPNLLPAEFVPGKWDVICQRGKECYEHVGNRRFRMCIDSHLDSYVEAKSRQQKSKIVSSIVQNIRKASSKTGGGFVRKDLLTRRWFRVDDKLAREKVGQALRDAIKTKRVRPDDDKKQPSASKSIALADTVSSKDVESDFKMAISTSTAKPFNDKITRTSSGDNIDLGFSGLYDTSFAEEKHIQQLEREQDQIAPAQHQQLVNFHIPPPPPAPAPSLFFNSRLSAELEPTPIPQHHNQATGATNPTSSMYPSLGRGGGASHRRSEMSASTLLRLYDQSYGSNMTRGTSNLDNTATNTGVALDADTTRAMDLQNTRRAQLAAAELYSTPIAAAASSIEPPVLQHVLPTFIEGRILTDTLTDSGTTMMGTTSASSLNLPDHHNHHQLFSLSTTMNHAEWLNKLRTNESSTTASNQEGLHFASNIDAARPSNTEQHRQLQLHDDNEVGAADPNTAFEDL